MTINRKKYVIASKTFPLMFYNEHGFELDDFEDAILSKKELAEDILNHTFDEPEEYQVLEINIRYEI